MSSRRVETGLPKPSIVSDNRPDGVSRRRCLSLIGLLGAVPLAGCFEPLYGQRVAETGTDLRASLQTVQVAEAGDRTAQVFRNELLFLLRGGKSGADPLYRLEYRIAQRVSAVSVQVLSDVPQSYILTLTVVYTLWDIGEDRVVLNGSSFANASFSFSNQRFANARAQLDAQQRAAKVIAGEVRTRIATFMASGTA
ncbi:MAG: LPS assembly lipoprotein LptE [Pseudomonadota bacterium]